MKCSHRDCNRGIGLVAYRRGWFDSRRYCSRQCRDTSAAERPKQPQQGRSETTYFDWLFVRSVEKPRSKLTPAVFGLRASKTLLEGNPRYGQARYRAERVSRPQHSEF